MKRFTLFTYAIVCGLGLGALLVGLKLANDWSGPIKRVSASQEAYFKAQTELTQLQNERLKSASSHSAEAPKPAPPKQESKTAVPAPAEAPKPAPLLPGAGASVDAGGAPNCSDSGDLKQAVNPNPRATQYTGQLLVGSAGKPGGRTTCYEPGTYVHPTLGKFTVGRK